MRKVPSSPASTGRSYPIKSLAKALNILDVLAEGDDSACTLTQLSRDLRLHVSTAYRLVANLLSHGFVEEAPDSRGYRLSYKVLRMGLRVLDRLDFRQVAEPLLRELSQQTGGTVGLAILHGTSVILIEKYVGSQATDLEAGVGEVMPFHCTGVGKTLLAFQTRKFFEQIARTTRLDRFTPQTISNLAALRKELDDIRDQGYALDQEESRPGRSAVAAPLLDHRRRVIAAFSLSGPAANFAPPRRPDMVRLVCTTGQQISFRLGYRL